MASGGPSPIPEELLITLDEERILSKDPKDLLKVMQDLVKGLKRMYADVADAINLAPEYQEEAAEPEAAEGRFLVWKDSGTGIRYLVYNDGGTQVKVPLEAPAAKYVTLRIPHTWAIPGLICVPSGEYDYIVPFFVSLPTGQTAKLAKARYVIHGAGASPSATVKLQKNGADITGFTSVSVTTTAASTDPADVDLADNDLLALVVTAVSGTPWNLTFTILIDYKQEAVE